ncbi:hypothetical protein DSL72_002769 [Monilinia vaccinii-corymbosi]|uniref:RlpA-like protein double-psi beta-barrel domain-containing protein n=1 Tax=Monilinia vaccinii-corymbosi TaxID=61207 RepID=A0A8A3PDN8_9HELO|nr:hypothetical protein DSL72_002769 [Monilinia vaccinii-corymbosi]
MKYATTLLSGLMAAAVVAQPHLRHRHAARHEKRDIVWVTESDVITETVDYTTTVYVTPGYAAPTSSSAPSVTPSTFATIPTSSAAASSSMLKSTAAASSSANGAASNPKPSSSSSTHVAPPSSISVVLPTTSSTYVAPVSSTTSRVALVSLSVSASVALPTFSTTPLVVPTTSIPPVVPPSYTPSAPVPPTPSAPSSPGGVCSPGSPCSGDMTYYTAGLGACGITTDGSNFAGVALPVGLMGSLSNSNPYCGKTITIKCTSTGKTTQATVIDKCMGCEGDSIDLTNFAFDKLADEAVGRTKATWFFND